MVAQVLAIGVEFRLVDPPSRFLASSESVSSIAALHYVVFFNQYAGYCCSSYLVSH